MSFIKAEKLDYEYVTRDEEGNITSVSHALDKIDLNIEKGEFVAVLGRNGSGKSTFAKLLNAILLPTTGDVWVYEMNTRDEEKLLEIRRTVGMVFQNPDNQIIANVVEEDVAFGPENLGIPTDEIWNRVNTALEMVGMVPYRMKSPNNLSGGQKQRVAIAGVMAMTPACIVLDEPTAMLDPNGRKEILRTITELNRTRGVTIVLITHYMEEAIGADRIVVIDHGQAVMDDNPKKIFSQRMRLKELGLDVPQVTELADKLREAGMDLPEGITDTDEFVEAVARKLHIQ